LYVSRRSRSQSRGGNRPSSVARARPVRACDRRPPSGGAASVSHGERVTCACSHLVLEPERPRRAAGERPPPSGGAASKYSKKENIGTSAAAAACSPSGSLAGGLDGMAVWLAEGLVSRWSSTERGGVPAAGPSTVVPSDARVVLVCALPNYHTRAARSAEAPLSQDDCRGDEAQVVTGELEKGRRTLARDRRTFPPARWCGSAGWSDGR
jgi:hypothetical protein